MVALKIAPNHFKRMAERYVCIYVYMYICILFCFVVVVVVVVVVVLFALNFLVHSYFWKLNISKVCPPFLSWIKFPRPTYVVVVRRYFNVHIQNKLL